jgi:hypothetical protein
VIPKIANIKIKSNEDIDNCIEELIDRLDMVKYENTDFSYTISKDIGSNTIILKTLYLKESAN